MSKYVMLTYFDIIRESATAYDIEGKYRTFNDLYFGGVLPTIPLKMAPLKSVSGVCKCRIVRPQGSPLPQRGKKKTYEGCRVTGIDITLSNLHIYSETEYDGILLHEMIHAWMFHHGKLTENHGPNFEAMRRDISRRSGISIPLTETLMDRELSSDQTKPVGVMLVQKSEGSYSMSLCSPKKVQAEAWETEWSRRLARGMKASLPIMNTPGWTKIAERLPIGRAGFKSFYRVMDQDTLAEILADTPLAKVEKA